MNAAESMQVSRLSEIAEQLEQSAAALRAEPDGDSAQQLASRCAELASQAAVELDRLARSAPEASLPGQEELL